MFGVLVNVKFCVVHTVSYNALVCFRLFSRHFSNPKSKPPYSNNSVNFKLIASKPILVLGVPSNDPKRFIGIQIVITFKVNPVFVSILHKGGKRLHRTRVLEVNFTTISCVPNQMETTLDRVLGGRDLLGGVVKETV